MVQDVEVGRAADAEPALVADATGAASVSAHAGDGQARVVPTNNGDLYAAAKAYVDAYDAAVVCWVLAPDFYDKLETVFVQARNLVAVKTLWDQPCPYDGPEQALA